jgi:tetratricopeptide (TPR) repeat protein
MLKSSLTSELVKKFIEALEKILKYKKEGKNDEALSLINDTFKELFRLDSKFFNSFSDENLMDMIKTDGTINADKCIMMAELLKEEGEIYETQENFNEAFYLNLKSINLLLEAYINKDNNCDLQNYFSDIDLIIEKISDYKLPNVLESKIIEYYIIINKYDKAEDTLYVILENNNFSKDSVEKGIAFYEQLLSKDDETLEKGNLPREEIHDSLSHLKEKL